MSEPDFAEMIGIELTRGYLSDLDGVPVTEDDAKDFLMRVRHGAVQDLLTELYAIHPVGGPLHVAVDDYNLDGVITPYYACYTDADLDALYYDGWPIAELSPEAPAVVEGLGRSLRQICDELAALLNAMTVEEREAAVARHHGGRNVVPMRENE